MKLNTVADLKAFSESRMDSVRSHPHPASSSSEMDSPGGL